MDLMTVNTTYAKLRTKYRNFGAPTVRIHVDGTEIIEKLNARISGLEVDITSGFSASGCGFDVICQYEAKNTDFDARGAAGLLQLGAKVELELGYIETVPVFYGLIVETEYILGDAGPTIHVECMDAKFLLMKGKKLQLFNGKSITEAIGELLDAQPFSSYVKGKKIEAGGDKLDMIPAGAADDYQFIVYHTRRIGREFFILQGKAYLRAAPSSASPVMTLSPNGGLLSVKLSLRGGSLYKKTRVVGINPENDQMVSGEADLDGKFGKGPGASQMLGQSVKTHFDHMVTSAESAAAQAKALMQEARGGFGRMECRCIGLPELAPGRSVTIQGVSSEADRDFYILEVRHTLDERGFFTTLEARIDTL